MKKLRSLLFCFLYCCVWSKIFASTIFILRQLSYNPIFENAATYSLKMYHQDTSSDSSMCESCMFLVKPIYTQNVGSKFSRYFTIDNKPVLNVQEDGTGDISSLWFQVIPSAGVVTYTPNTGYVGQDSFTFTATNSSGVSSAQAKVLITVVDTPVANSVATTVGVNSANNTITLTGVDPLAASFTFALQVGTSHGTLSAFNSSNGVVSYTPNAGYVGQDSFTFTATNSSGVSSAQAKVLISVVDTPVAVAQAVNVAVNSTNNNIPLTGTDLLGQAFTFTLGVSPSHGTVASFNSSTGVLTYTPNLAYVGQDTFTFTVTNSSGITSAPATVTVTVVDIPVAISQAVTCGVNSSNTAISLLGKDSLGHVVTFALANGSGPSHGKLSGFNATTGAVTYTPNAGYVGQDSFMFVVKNTSSQTSQAGIVTINIQ